MRRWVWHICCSVTLILHASWVFLQLWVSLMNFWQCCLSAIICDVLYVIGLPLVSWHCWLCVRKCIFSVKKHTIKAIFKDFHDIVKLKEYNDLGSSGTVRNYYCGTTIVVPWYRPTLCDSLTKWHPYNLVCVGGMAGLQNMMKKFQQGAAGKPGNMFWLAVIFVLWLTGSIRLSTCWWWDYRKLSLMIS